MQLGGLQENQWSVDTVTLNTSGSTEIPVPEAAGQKRLGVIVIYKSSNSFLLGLATVSARGKFQVHVNTGSKYLSITYNAATQVIKSNLNGWGANGGTAYLLY